MLLKFGIDIDGTVTDPSTFLPYLNKDFKRTLSYADMNQYDLSKVLGIPLDEFLTWFKSTESEIYENAPLAKHAKSALNHWINNHRLVYVSARGEEHLDATSNWFEVNNVCFHELHLVGSKRKSDFVAEHNISLFFEDKHDTACDIAETNNIPVILLDAPYNQGSTPKGVVRVSNWLEAKSWVDNWLKQTRE